MDCTHKELILCPLLSIIGLKERELNKAKVSTTLRSKGEETNSNEQPSEYVESKLRNEVGGVSPVSA